MNTDRAIGAVDSETRSCFSGSSKFLLFDVFRISAANRTRTPGRSGLSCAPQNPSQESSGVRIFDLRDLLRRSDANHFAAFVPCFGSKIDNPIGGFNY